MRSRVIPGSLVTIERREAVSRLKIVDLPTLGRPTITTDGNFSVIFFCRWGHTDPYTGGSESSSLPYRARKQKRCARPQCGLSWTMAKAKEFDLDKPATVIEDEDEKTLAAIDEGIRDA